MDASHLEEESKEPVQRNEGCNISEITKTNIIRSYTLTSTADLEPISIISSWSSEDFDDWIMYQDVDQILIDMNQYHQMVI